MDTARSLARLVFLSLCLIVFSAHMAVGQEAPAFQDESSSRLDLGSISVSDGQVKRENG